MTAAAQPTPASTVIALAGQFVAHAPHSMHKSLSTIRAFLSATLKTPCGHTSSHLPHPTHFSSAKESETTFSRYVSAIYLSS
jgi:hypothetical protein